MALYLEPQNGDFQKLAEQLVNQSQTTATLKQSVIAQLNLEETKAKIQSSHRSALQELHQENQPQAKMQGQTLRQANTIQPVNIGNIGPKSSTLQQSRANSTSEQGHVTQTVKRSASQKAHELHQRPISAANQAHSLHQRPQSASTTAHNLHTNQGLSASPVSQTPAQATKLNTDSFLKVHQDNPQLLDNPLLMHSQGSIPEYLTPQLETVATKLTFSQYFSAIFTSIALSCFFTFFINMGLDFFKVYPPASAMISMWTILMVFLYALMIARFRSINRNNQLNLSNTLQKAQTQAAPETAPSPKQAQITNPVNPNFSATTLEASTPKKIPSLASVFLFVALIVIFIAAAPFIIIGVSHQTSINPYVAMLLTLLFFLAVPVLSIAIIFRWAKQQKAQIAQGVPSKNSFGQVSKASFAQKVGQDQSANNGNITQQFRATTQAGQANSPKQQSNQTEGATSQNSNKSSGLAQIWGAFVISAALTAILYGAVLEDFIRQNYLSGISIIPVCFVAIFIFVTIWMRHKTNNSTPNKNISNNRTFRNNKNKPK